MRRKLVGLAVTALLIGGASSPAAAQARGYFGFGAGVSLPVGDFGDCCKTGWLGQVIAGVTSANGMIGGRIDGTFARHSIKSTGTASAGSVKLLGANADLVWTPGSGAKKLRPYLLGGVGFFNAKSSGDGETNFAFNAGGGLLINAGGQMNFYTEARYISIQGDGSTSFIPISIGLRWGGN